MSSGFVLSFSSNHDSWVEYDTPIQTPRTARNRLTLATSDDIYAAISEDGAIYAAISEDGAVNVKNPGLGLPEIPIGVTTTSCVVALSNTILGAGMLGLPHAFSECGWALGYGMLFLSATLSTLGLSLLSRCAGFPILTLASNS